ncbi:hypothetical protein [Mobiluncus curtisii]|uniref:hypothetical protein n=1 Tax=Mobiluncus curtisii TaxID=2051 RepID=UPI00209333C1|nr:hypothetical protein [Mobiluncus curtisii]
MVTAVSNLLTPATRDKSGRPAGVAPARVGTKLGHRQKLGCPVKSGYQAEPGNLSRVRPHYRECFAVTRGRWGLAGRGLQTLPLRVLRFGAGRSGPRRHELVLWQRANWLRRRCPRSC